MDTIYQMRRKPEGKRRPGRQSRSSIGADLDYLDAERSIKSHPNDNVKRRTLLMKKIDNSGWGFTLQTYGIKHKKTNEIEIMTYVDYVEITGPAFMAGMRKGDVILSVDGQTVDMKTHKELVEVVKGCGDSTRMVVMFENCCKKVELHDRIFRLKNMLAYKKNELKELELREREVIDEYCQSKGLPRFDPFRQSMISTVSTNSWDRYSIIQSPHLLELPVPKVSPLAKNSIEGDHSSSTGGDELDDSFMSYVDSDADSGMCICCPTVDDKIPMKTLKDPERKKSIKNMVQNGNIPTKNWNHGKCDEDSRSDRYSVPFIYTDFVYINEEDESTEL